jgi:hypothetical protein
VKVGEKTPQLGPLETDPVSETSCSLEYLMMEKVQKPSNSVCYTPSSEPFRIYHNTCYELSPARNSTGKSVCQSVSQSVCVYLAICCRNSKKFSQNLPLSTAKLTLERASLVLDYSYLSTVCVPQNSSKTAG